MKLVFRLRFHTHMGQSLFLTGDHKMFGAGRIENAIPLKYLNPEFWEATIELPAGSIPNSAVTWMYVLKNPDSSEVRDWGNNRILHPAAFAQAQVLIIDSWNDMGAVDNVFYSEPFKMVLLRENRLELPTPPVTEATHTFKIKAPRLTKDQTLCVMGNCAELRQWNTANPLLLGRAADDDSLIVRVNLRHAAFPLSYKYGVFDTKQNKFIGYETGENRILSDHIEPDKHTVVNDGFVRLPATAWKGAGVAIPVFSLRSENSFGVGEFTDLKLLADWCVRAGLKLIQILPVNDTSATATWRDSYPYAAISAFALHPLYLNLAGLLKGRNRKLPKALEDERKRLNSLDVVDYEAVMRAKLKFVRKIFSRQNADTFAQAEYQSFFKQNKHWLVPYAAFCALRDKFGTSDFYSWPAHRTCRAGEISTLLKTDAALRGEVELNYFIQFHLHLQLTEAKEYANAHGVVMKGDIAIGVNRHGADVWQQPELFNPDAQTGAPPDAFAAKGQNWGFPTYNWPRMKQDNFLWWQQRFAQMSGYFDAFRIDHILGFFRIWSTPSHAVEAILGHFVPAIPVQEAEFAARGISFDRERYLKPFINGRVLQDLFGGDYQPVKEKYLALDPGNNWVLKPEFSTQAQVEEHFAALKNSGQNQKLKEALFDLISNVILLEAEGANGCEFHFRFSAEDTSSFKNLSVETRAKMKELYVDYFFRRQEELWRREGMQRLPALKRVTNMLICGEDLGLVPACVPEVMKQLALLSLEIQRMPKALNAQFSRPADAPYLSVVTPSTHDMSTIRGWWEEDILLTQKFYNLELGLPGMAPPHCSEKINRRIVEQHLASPAMWSIFQWQDLMGMDAQLRRPDASAERINVPANTKHYWRYRMHLSLEELLGADWFSQELKSLISKWRP